MASTQEPEIIFAQKLASNEKPIRSKALLKLKKYISVRSERAEGGFSDEELLKIWKGLFYCLWMQDKPLLQEELSTQISGLLHSFRTIDSQFLYFKTFLLTMKREWVGIDRLRMDKFYQLVRFVFRQAFEMLKRRQWESSVVSEFLNQFSTELLQSSSAAPAGLILHVLELYMTELALIGSAELTAEQNQTFIEPFCRSMAKTKDRVLLKAIGSNIFGTIIDQVPYAIEDLMREIHQDAGDESDSSEGSENEEELKTKRPAKNSQKCIAANANGPVEDSEDEISLSDLDTKDDFTCGPVLQFDYSAIANRLFELASHTNISSFNRSKIYKFVKIFRDLSEGVFPQDEVEDVSSDEDDDDDDHRRKKRKRGKKGQTEEETLAKKSKASKGSETTESKDTGTSQTNKKKKKNKKKNKKKRSLKSVKDEKTTEDQQKDTDKARAEEAQTCVDITSTEDITENKQTETSTDLPENKALSEVKMTGEALVSSTNADRQSVTSANGDQQTNNTENAAGATTRKKRKYKKQKAELLDAREAEFNIENNHSTNMNSSITPTDKQSDALDLKLLKKQQRKKKTTSRADEVTSEEVADCSETAEFIPPVPLKNKRKLKKKTKDTDDEVKEADCVEMETVTEDTISAKAPEEASSVEETTTNISAAKPSKKKRKQKNTSTNEQSEADAKYQPDSVNGNLDPSRKRPKKKNKKEGFDSDGPESEGNGDSESIHTENVQTDPDRLEHADIAAGKVRQKKMKQKAAAGVELNGDSNPADQIKPGMKRKVMNEHTKTTSMKRLNIISEAKESSLPENKKNKGFMFCQKKTPTPLFCKAAGYSTPVSKKQFLQTSKSESKKVTFGLKNNKTMEFRKMDQSSLASPAGQSRVPFDPKRTPKSGVLKTPSPALMRRTIAADFF
ncbi:ribosomal RNA processing protein 1 homolog B [Myxocyprinus asiaticus]|uniref:ribosomal RNA processing protein 1 homolog B n=1 Tax=Myxocyprinus asiaticus TaxID=70543 RepID=UPI0022234870|nr:ribosomal RNA processing protein 1 homolog B [Myxocyprinus asiaticus]